MNRDDPSMLRLSVADGLEQWLDTTTGRIHALPEDRSKPGPLMLALESAMVEIDIPYRLETPRVAIAAIEADVLRCETRITADEKRMRAHCVLSFPLLVPLYLQPTILQELEAINEESYDPFSIDEHTGIVSMWFGVRFDKGPTKRHAYMMLRVLAGMAERYQGVVLRAVMTSVDDRE